MVYEFNCSDEVGPTRLHWMSTMLMNFFVLSCYYHSIAVVVIYKNLIIVPRIDQGLYYHLAFHITQNVINDTVMKLLRIYSDQETSLYNV